MRLRQLFWQLSGRSLLGKRSVNHTAKRDVAFSLSPLYLGISYGSTPLESL
jgi:hypothetical protein